MGFPDSVGVAVMLDSTDLAALDLATQSFSQVLGSLEVEFFDHPTACGDWTVKDVANHVCGGGLRYAHYLRGGMPEDIAWTRTSDNVGNDPHAAHDNLSAELRTLFAKLRCRFDPCTSPDADSQWRHTAEDAGRGTRGACLGYCKRPRCVVHDRQRSRCLHSQSWGIDPAGAARTRVFRERRTSRSPSSRPGTTALPHRAVHAVIITRPARQHHQPIHNS